ncbi:hypothetical protein [Comamonas suwonensis]|uniref:Uncharacterized protein n=1 Tax=Comamonas suwonensis TaxID=2606214 RepID=A0A843B865_9BURK|nr:hypothetical protein [Comamonas suwonensis]MBI1627011.1 hypothetical protein [Comamonas suwonensis]
MNGTRTLKLVVLAVATVLLAGGAWQAQSGLKRLSSERQQSAVLRQSLDDARNLMPEVQTRERLVHSLNEVAREVNRLGFDPARWGERKLRRPLGAASRVDASEFLGELGRGGPDSIFVADLFDIATASPETGLFQQPQPGDMGLTLGVSGTLYFQTVSVAQPPRMFP